MNPKLQDFLVINSFNVIISDNEQDASYHPSQKMKHCPEIDRKSQKWISGGF